MNRYIFTICFAVILFFSLIRLNAQWKQLEVGPPGQVWSLGKMGNYIFAGAFAGIYRTTDQGKSWTNVSPYFARCYAVKGTEIFAGTYQDGVICSRDSGKTWQITDTSLHGEINAIAIKGNYMFAGGGAVMLRSTDDGSSWTLIQNGLTYGQTTVTGMVVTEGKILASTFAGVVISTDNGDDWSTLVGTNSADAVTNCIAVIDSTVLVGWPGGVIRSTDDGRSWDEPGGWISTSTTFSIIGNSSRIYAGTIDGVHVSTDDGITWAPVNNGLPVEQGWHLTQNDTNLFVADGNYGVYISSDSGSSWTQQSEGIRGWTGEYLTGSGAHIFATMSSPTGGSQLLYHSTDNGNTWMQDTSWHGGWIQSITVTIPFIYATTNSGIFASSDNGKSWGSINGGIMDTVYPMNVIKSGSNLIVSTQKKGELFLSSDNGGTWQNVGKNLPIIGPLAGSGDNVFAGNEGDWTNSNDGIYESTNNGLNWTLINDTLTNISSLETSGSTIIAAGYTPPIPVGSPPPPPGGIFRSTDNGRTWKTYVDSLPDKAQVYSLAIYNNYVFAGLEYLNYPSMFYTSNLNKNSWTNEGKGLAKGSINSIYVNDSTIFVGTEMTGLWSIPMPEVTAIRKTINSTFPSSYKLEQNYPNPFNPTTNISYSLPRDGFVTLKVYDILGREVRTLINERQSAGNHSVTFDASDLASGVYFYRLIARPMGTHSVGNFVDAKKLVLLK